MKQHLIIYSLLFLLFRGIETYNFVRDINSRYESYKKKIKS
jgi:hypothetical protein